MDRAELFQNLHHKIIAKKAVLKAFMESQSFNKKEKAMRYIGQLQEEAKNDN